jgi:hypothetical protein
MFSVFSQVEKPDHLKVTFLLSLAVLGTLACIPSQSRGQTTSPPLTFGGFYSFPSYNGSGMLKTGDVNGDGIPDVVTIAPNGLLQISYGDGKGGFKSAWSTTLGSTNAPPTSVQVADLNGDGLADVVVGVASGYITTPGTVHILLSQPDGSLRDSLSIAAVYGNVFVTIGDMNLDGKPDLIITSTGNFSFIGAPSPSTPPQGSLQVLLGDGKGGFSQSVLSSGFSNDGEVTIGDVNGDGSPDVVAISFTWSSSSSNWVPCIESLFGNRKGQFTGGLCTGTNVVSAAVGPFLQLGAFVKTGRLDVLLSGRFLYKNNGDGTFGAGIEIAANLTSADNAGAGGFTSATSDLDGDGNLDIVLTNTSGMGVMPLYGNGDDTFVLGLGAAGGGKPASLAIADVNGDGKPDIVVADADTNTFTSVLNLGNRSFAGVSDISSIRAQGQTNLGRATAAGDFTGDGKADVLGRVVGSSTLQLLVWPGNANGKFGTPVTSTSTIADYSNTSITRVVVAADFNNDGKLDAVVETPSGIATAIGKGDGTFNIGIIPGISSVFRAVGDVNGDKILDIVSQDGGTDFNIQVSLGKGDGTFQKPTTVTGNFYPGYLYTADLNGDGKDDIVASIGQVLSGGIFVSYPGILLSKGDGTFGAPILLSSPGPALAFASGDFNEDGKTDLTYNDGSKTYVCLGNGDGTFQKCLQYVFSASALYVVDVNGDGHKDLVISAANSVTVMLGRGDGTFSSPFQYPASQSFAMADINGDGAPDLLTSYTLLNAGGTQISASSTPGIPTKVQVVINPSVAGFGPPTGSVSAFVGGKQVDTQTVSAGSAVLSVNPTSASQNVTLTYSGDRQYNPKTSQTTIAAAAPAVTLSPAALTFVPQVINTTSTVQTITLTNSGGAALTVASVTVSGDFAATSGCGSSVSAGASCNISVTFTPTATGNRTGTLTITDNANGSPHTVALNGTGATFGVSSNSNSLTATPGESATATIQIAPVNGFTGTVNLTCVLNYQGQGTPSSPPTCSLSPSQAQISSTSPISSTLTVSTTAATALLIPGWALKGSGVALAVLLFGGVPRRCWRTRLLAVLCLAAIGGMSGCSGGKSSGGNQNPPTNTGTTKGSYQVVVTATSGTATTTTTIPLTVQ